MVQTMYYSSVFCDGGSKYTTKPGGPCTWACRVGKIGGRSRNMQNVGVAERRGSVPPPPIYFPNKEEGQLFQSISRRSRYHERVVEQGTHYHRTPSGVGGLHAFEKIENGQGNPNAPHSSLKLRRLV